MLQFSSSDIHFPSQWPSPTYPTARDVKKRIRDKKLFVSFYSLDGYDFTAEFEHVYSGDTSHTSIFDDVVAVCKRAIVSADPGMTVSTSDLDVLADYVTRMAAWEAGAGDSVAAATVASALPLLDATVIPPTLTLSRYGHHVRIYIGFDPTSTSKKNGLCFWVRTSPRLTYSLSKEAAAKRLVSLREAAAEDRANGRHDETAGNDDEEIDIDNEVVRLCYVRRYQLDAAVARAMGCIPIVSLSMGPDAKRWHMEQDRQSTQPSQDEDDGSSLTALYTALLTRVIPAAAPGNAAGAVSNSRAPSEQPPAQAPAGTVSLYFVFTQLPSEDPDPASGAAAAAAAENDRALLDGAATADSVHALGSQIRRSPSACADLMGWGHNTASNLGFNFDDGADGEGVGAVTKESEGKSPQIFMPRSVPMHPLMMMERVKMIACSPKHTLLLSFHGSLFSCGENSEGALGLGDLYSRPGFTRITFAAGQSRVAADDEDFLLSPEPASTSSGAATTKAARIVKIAAGSSAIGSHSAALDSEGQLFVWGVSYAVGMGTVKPTLEPALLNTFRIDDVEREHKWKWERAQRARQQRANSSSGRGGASADASDDAGADGAAVGAEVGDEQMPPPGDNDAIFGSVACIDVACGGGFTVAVTRSGRVASFGTWSHGRLGLGPIPMLGRTRSGGGDGGGEGDDLRNNGSRSYASRLSGARTKLARYQLRPVYIAGLRGARAVACGESHTLCATATGDLYAWGQNTCGQVGLGPDVSGMLRDRDVPELVKPFDVGSATAEQGRVKAVKVFAGSYHSVVIDHTGSVWTWGARGSPCLGHGDSVSLQGAWANRVNAVFAASTTQTKVMVPYELRAWCSEWARPRKLPPMTHEDHRVVHVSAGDMHTAILTSVGSLYLCGAGPVVPPFFSESGMRQQTQRRRKKTKAAAPSSASTDKAASERDGDKSREEEDAELEADNLDLAVSSASIVSLPRRPSASWLSQLSAKSVLLIASSGTRCFVLQDEELVSSSLTGRLMRNLMFGNGRGGDSAEGAVLDDVSLDSLARSEASSVRGKLRHEEQRKPFYFEQRGRADCMLIASGKILLAHRAILSQRSPQLRDMIAMETENAVDGDGFDVGDDFSVSVDHQPGAQYIVKLLLPELHSDAAKALLCYLYTDVLPHSCIGNTFLLRALQRAGKSLRIPRLQLIAESHLEALSFVELELLVMRDGSNPAGTRDFVEKVGANSSMDMPPSTLARDMGSLLGEPLFADVRFVAEGRAVMAHKFILESRSEYFRALFRSGMGEMSSAVMRRVPGSRRRERKSVVDIQVPDTFVGFLRLLLFIYTDTLPDGSDDALLEDLLSADRYGLRDMKDLCESMLVPSKDNWFNLLRAAELVSSEKLRALTMSFLQDNFAVLLGTVDVDVEPEPSAEQRLSTPQAQAQTQVSYITFLRSEFPDLLDTILDQRTRSFPLPPSQVILQHLREGTKLKSKLTANSADSFPTWALFAMAGCAVAYPHVSNIISLGPFVQIFNVIFGIGIIVISLGVLNKRT